MDRDPFQQTEVSDRHVAFEQKLCLQNYVGEDFHMRVNRVVRVLTDHESESHLGLPLPAGVASVGHESRNRVTNVSSRDWQSDTGLPAVWILSMNKPSPAAVVMVPFRPGPEASLGKIVNADYFGPLEATRLRTCQESNLIYFRGDGQYRSKLGVSFPRAVDFLGAWDGEHGCLTLVQFNLPKEPAAGYTNNLWREVEDPFSGDVINSYNDGPNETGGRMGPFYELETLSPGLPLAAGQSGEHVHRTFHLEGNRSGLNQVMMHVFGVEIGKVESVFVGTT